MKHALTVIKFRPCRHHTLVGFATVRIDALGLDIGEVSVHQHPNGHRWTALPAKPLLDADGVAQRNPDGKIAYAAVLGFRDRAVGEAFSKAVLAALLKFDPDAFNEAAA
jgi:hypothetical protein